MSRLYVAYGSNLNLEQMALRCPDAVPYCKGVLKNWRLSFKSTHGIGVLSIDREKGQDTPVLIWEISDKDEKNLDVYEGYPRLYYKQNVMVHTEFGKKKAMVYIITDRARYSMPIQRYYNACRQGYEDNGFDIESLDEAVRFTKRNCFKIRK